MWLDGRVRILSLTLAMACRFDASGAGTTGGVMPASDTSGSAGVGPSTTTEGDSVADADASATGVATTTTGVDDGTDTTEGDSSSTGPGCTPGEQGCSCVGEACDPGLACVDDVCLDGTCGDETVDAGEDCDDGNAEDGDGCESDCTFTPGAAAVVAGFEHTCARFHSGQVVCWGRGGEGRLGYGSNVGEVGDSEPANTHGFVDTGGFVVQLALGANFTCARFDDGDVRCWGAAGQGRLGQGMNTGNVGDDEVPSTLAPIMLGGPAIDIAAGDAHACAVIDTGDVLCWGAASEGRLGYGMSGDIGNDETPASVGPVPLGEAAEQVVAGSTHTCALLTGGDVRCWGRGDVGQLGNGETETIGDDETPLMEPNIDIGGTVVRLAAGGDHTCALLDDDELRCWGRGGSGQLGYGETNNIGGGESPASVGSVAVGAGVVAMDLGEEHTCVLLENDDIKCWGAGGSGRLGSEDTADLLMPSLLEVSLGPVVSTGLTAGGAHSCVRRVDGQIMCWGEAARGQLGYGNANDIGDDEPPLDAGTVPFIP